MINEDVDSILLNIVQWTKINFHFEGFKIESNRMKEEQMQYLAKKRRKTEKMEK